MDKSLLTVRRTVKPAGSTKSSWTSSGTSSHADHRSVSTAATSNVLTSANETASPVSVLQAATVNIPLELPPPPHSMQEVDLTTLTLDEELEDLPIGLVVGKMKANGTSLLSAATSTVLHVPKTPSVPDWLECDLPPVALAPTHLLAISTSDQPRTLLVPVHGLLFAAQCEVLKILSSSPSRQRPHPALPQLPAPRAPDAPLSLPVVQLTLPSSQAFPIVQAWIYLNSPNQLLASLLPPSQPSPAPCSSLSNLLNPTALSLSQTISTLPRQRILHFVTLVHGVWQTVVALHMADERLWSTMRLAWRILVGACVLQQRTSAASNGSGAKLRQDGSLHETEVDV